MNKILIIDSSISMTGALKSILNSTTRINEFTFYYALKFKPVNQLNLPNARHFNFLEIKRSMEIFLYLPKLIYNSLLILRWIRREGIEIIHVNDLYNMVGVVIKLMHPKVRLIHHVRLMPDSYARSLYFYWLRLIYWKSEVIVCVSQKVLDAIPETPKKKIIYDFTVIPENIRGAISDESETRFIYPANYIRGKGHEYAIQAFKRVLLNKENIRLEFVGSDMGLMRNAAYLDELKRLSGGEVKILFGAFETDILSKIFKNDVVLVFSDSESFSMVCLEAGLLAKPVIATKCGGPEEILIDGVTGILVEKKSIDGMVRAIERLVENPALRVKLGENAKRDLMERFNPEILIQSHLHLYQGLTNNEGR